MICARFASCNRHQLSLSLKDDLSDPQKYLKLIKSFASRQTVRVKKSVVFSQILTEVSLLIPSPFLSSPLHKADPKMAVVLNLVRDSCLCSLSKPGDRENVTCFCGDFPVCDVLHESAQIGPRGLILREMIFIARD
jgi:hypothetical protein